MLVSRLRSLSWRTKWYALRCFERALFFFVYPLAARVGGAMARWFASLIGRVSYHLDVDWRTVSIRQHFVRERTLAAMREIAPGASSAELSMMVRERFVFAAQEELDAHYFFLDRALVRQCSFEGLEEVRAVAGKLPIIYLTLHLDSTLMAVAQMGKAGLKVNLMTSNIVEDGRVPPVVRRFFRLKYEGIRHHLRGGHFWHFETHMRDFYRALGRGEGAVILCETPAQTMEDGLQTEFLGETRLIKRGALRLAEKTGAALVGMICLRTGLDRYKIVFSPVFEPALIDSRSAIQKVYAFLGEAVRSAPERWWAADLLPSFIKVGGGPQ